MILLGYIFSRGLFLCSLTRLKNFRIETYSFSSVLLFIPPRPGGPLVSRQAHYPYLTEQLWKEDFNLFLGLLSAAYLQILK